MKRLVACLALLSAFPPLGAQESHFDGWKWRERTTDHFILRADSTGHDPASRHAEKVWEVVVGILPGLEKDFAENLFRTPSGDEGAAEAPYRHSVYLLGRGDDFNRLLDIDAGRYGWDGNRITLIRRTANYADPNHRYGVFSKADPNRSGGGDRDITAIFAHSTATTLLAARARSRNLPFWMKAGFGYYVEHRLFSRCRVHYLDFEAYYRDNEADIKQGETLGPDKAWPRILQRLCKDGKRVSLDDVLSAQVLTLSPNESGYIFALTCFLVRDEPAREKYRQLVARARDGGTVEKAFLLETYGYPDAAALEAEWYAWMEGRDFK